MGSFAGLNQFDKFTNAAVGGSTCSHPGNSWPAEVQAITDPSLCAIKCLALQTCHGFNIKSSKCELCTNHNVGTHSGVTAYLRKSVVPRALLLCPVWEGVGQGACECKSGPHILRPPAGVSRHSKLLELETHWPCPISKGCPGFGNGYSCSCPSFAERTGSLLGFLEVAVKVSGGCSEVFWRLQQRFLEVAAKVSGGCSEGFWRLQRRFLEVAVKLSGGSHEGFWRLQCSFLEVAVKVSGGCSKAFWRLQ